MAPRLSLLGELLQAFTAAVLETPTHILLLISASLVGLGLLALYLVLLFVAPKPRLPFPSEKTYLTSHPSGTPVSRQLPCWYDRWLSERQLSAATNKKRDVAGLIDSATIEPAELAMTIIVPAYNEEQRILPALDEMVQYCDARFGRPSTTPDPAKKLHKPARTKRPSPSPSPSLKPHGGYSSYEIIVINDGSTDRTAEVVLDFALERGLHDIVRVVTLERNRGKGGGVTHGFRHARGAYVAFADADGASRFSDLGRLIEGCEDVVDRSNRAVAIGSRAHLVGSEAVVKVCCCLAAAQPS